MDPTPFDTIRINRKKNCCQVKNDIEDKQAPLGLLMVEVLLQQGRRILAAQGEQLYHPEAVYHEVHNFETSCRDYFLH